MWRSKKFLLLALLVPAVLVGSIGGVAFAQSGSDDTTQPEARHEALLDRIAAIYEENTGVAIDSEALRDAFAQAQSEMRAEALQNHLQSLVDEGKITQEEADQYLEWLQSRPDIELPLPGLGGHSHGDGMMLGRGSQALGGPWFAPDTSGEVSG